MDAIKFVKKYGKAVAVNLHNKSQGCKLSEVLFYDSKNDKYECVDSEDLKQIIDSWLLVDGYGGLKSAIYMRNHNMLLPEFKDELKKAIKVVEKCNES